MGGSGGDHLPYERAQVVDVVPVLCRDVKQRRGIPGRRSLLGVPINTAAGLL